MKHQKTLLILGILALTFIGYGGYRYYVNYTVVKAISLYLPDTKLKIVKTENRTIPSLFTDETAQAAMDNLSRKDGSKTVFMNKLKNGDKVKLYYIRFMKPYFYNEVDLSEKSCDGFLCFRFFMGYAYIDTTTGELLRLDVSRVPPK
ncbi:hypothetical protein HQN90_20645 [Paenibacillus alba]|uniref:hypothetical protein n=1 Tax=Paenibacillus alba TaxID=1197127 RepID=UPI001563DFB1|nr:hypothetical protein [Paenibacillus alba]NQX68538.1 hypothetical protein [Paenibacillus alba]